MAAYSALVTLSKAIHQILPYGQHYSFLCHRHKMQSLHDKVICFQVFLEDISAKSQHSSNDIDKLESRIRDVAYRLEDIVEPILVHSLALEYENQVNSHLSIPEANSQSSIGEASTKLSLTPEGRAASRKSFFKGFVNKIYAPYCGCSTVKDGTETSLDDILEWCLEQNKAKYSYLPLTERAAAAFRHCIEEADLLFEEAMKMKKILDKRVVIATASSYRDPPSATDTKVGLDGDLIQILDQITGRPPTFQVIPITGMGGIGKTTLARAVFEHPKTVNRFDVRLWATVSQQYNVKEILQGLLPGKQDGPVAELIVKVHKELVGRRYLIILDDVWDEKVWDGVRIAFPDDNNYSRVILTTRLSNVATNVIGSSSTNHAHQMQLLNEEQSWDLLRETVYGHGVGCPGEFEYMGRMVSRSCKGLPLALVVIGGLLKANKTRDYWLRVAERTTTEAAADDESLLKILSLSYRNLPPHLKACFLYFGMFPEDEEIRTKKLVMLWCAEGFLKAREGKTMEVVAEECLEELAERNMVLVKKKRYNGKIRTSSMHDVLRDLSLRQAHKEKFLYGHHGSSKKEKFRKIIKDEPRRVSFPYIRNLNFSSSSSSSPVRTLFQSEVYWDWAEVSAFIPHNFKLLRVFGKVELSSSSIRNSVRLNNLRYLHLQKEYNDAERSFMVPRSISKLRNLETLLVTSSAFQYPELFLPVEIWEMPRLRHLVSEVKMKLAAFPASGLDEVSSLQTLTGLLNFDFSPTAIQKLQNLKKLQIVCWNPFYAKVKIGFEDLSNLVNLHHLEDLTISRDYRPSPRPSPSPRVRRIGFPRNLKKLRLTNTEFPWEKMTLIGDSLEHLEVLKLEWGAFVGEVWEPIEGGFPQLKYLKMELLWELEEWRAESTHFPSLEKLLISKCPRLKQVPAEIGDIDTLEKLIVQKNFDDSVGDGFEDSVRRIEEEQQSAGNHSLQVIFLSKHQDLSQVDVHG